MRHRCARGGDPPPLQAFRALTLWLRRAQKQGRVAKCDVETLASTILGALARMGVHRARLWAIDDVR